MLSIWSALVFAIVLVAYLHTVAYLRTDSEPKVYDLSISDAQELDQVCKLRHPVVYRPVYSAELSGLSYERLSTDDPGRLVNVRLGGDHRTSAVPVRAALALISGENSDQVVSEGNHSFFRTPRYAAALSGLQEHMALRPCVWSSTDLLFGSLGARTARRVCRADRTFYHVAHGSVGAELVPPGGGGPDATSVKLDCAQGEALLVPPGWAIGVTFGPDALVVVCEYQSIGSVIANAPALLRGVLQRQNVQCTYASCRGVVSKTAEDTRNETKSVGSTQKPRRRRTKTAAVPKKIEQK